MLSLTARYGKDLPVINGGLVWRVFADKPDDTGTFKLIREERGATPNIVLPPGSYVVHVALGLVSAVRAVSLKAETDRVAFVLPAGGLRIEGRVGSSKIPPNQISFALYKGSQFEGGAGARHPHRPMVPGIVESGRLEPKHTETAPVGPAHSPAIEPDEDALSRQHGRQVLGNERPRPVELDQGPHRCREGPA